MSCEDCQKAAQRKTVIGVVGGVFVGAGVAFLVLRYARNR
jgi:hypothetical protein